MGLHDVDPEYATNERYHRQTHRDSELPLNLRATDYRHRPSEADAVVLELTDLEKKRGLTDHHRHVIEEEDSDGDELSISQIDMHIANKK